MPAVLAGQLQRIVDGILPATDAELLSAFVERKDRDAFTRIVERHGPMVLAVAARHGRQSNDRDDVFQAVFWLLARDARKIKKREHLAAWLHRVACRCAQRVKPAKPSSDPDLLPARQPDPALAAAWREVSAALDQEIARLPEDLRAPLVVCFLEGETQQAAARLLGVSFGTLRRRLDEARQTLRERLRRRGIGEAALLAMPAAVALPAPLLAQVIPYASGAALAASAAVLVPAGVLTMKTVSMALACTLAVGFLAIGGFTGHQPKAEPKKVVVPKEVPLVDELGDPLPEGALRRIGTNRMNGFRQIQFGENGTLLGIRWGGDVLEEIDPISGKVLSRLPITIAGQPFRTRRGVEGNDAVKLSVGGKYWIRCELRNGIGQQMEGQYETTLYDRNAGSRKLPQTIISKCADTSVTSPSDRYLFVRGHLPKNDPSEPPLLLIFELPVGTLVGAMPMEGDNGGLIPGDLIVSPTEKDFFLRKKKAIIRYSLPDLKEMARFEIGEGRPASISADGKKMAVLAGHWRPNSSGKDSDSFHNSVRIFDVETGREAGNLEKLGLDRVISADFDPLRERILVTGWNRAERKCETLFVEMGMRRIVQRHESAETKKLMFSKDGRTLLLLNDIGNARLLDADNGAELCSSAIAESPIGSIAGLALAVDGSAAVGAWDSGLLRFDAIGRRLGPPMGMNRYFCHLAYTSDGKTLLAASRTSYQIHWIDATTGTILRSFEIPGAPERFAEGQIPRVDFSRDGRRLIYEACRLETGQEQWELCEVTHSDDGKPKRRVLLSQDTSIQSWASHPDRNWIVEPSGFDPQRAGQQGTLFVTDTKSLKQIGSISENGRLDSMQFNHSGDRLAGIQHAKKIRMENVKGDAFIYKATSLDIHSMPDGKLLHSFENKDATAKFAFTPDDRFLVLCDMVGYRVFEISTGGLVLERITDADRTSRPDRCFASSISIAWDGKSVATGHADGTVLFWDLLRIDGKQPTKPKDDEIPGFLDSLASKDAKEAHTAGCRLMLLGDAVIPKLLASLKPDNLQRDRAKLLLERIATPAAREALKAVR